MRQLLIGGKVTEISEHDYLGLISNLAKGYDILAKTYHSCHFSGFADWKDTFQLPDVGQYEVVEAIVDAIDDKELSESLSSLRNHLREMEEVDRRIVDWLARFVGLTSVDSKKDKGRLERRLQKIIINGPDGHPQGPIWAMEAEYQAFVDESKRILASIEEAQRQIGQRIQQLLEKSAES